ncbi:MAG: DegT/DnrJ/EryC1/StrS family aminotransferase [candidate division Zixibacteria bacterium]|nr:DegT/DnrJ/EryC1/StrS family aminotransferase [candidate division Zixibacteria bacterium]
MCPANRIPLYDIKLSKAAIDETVASLKSGWLTSGPKTVAFEEAIAARCRVRQAAAVSSASFGLSLALYLAGTGVGSQVITSPLTFIATTTAILNAGLEPVYCDIDPVTLNIDATKVSRKLTRKTRLILPIDIAGHPCDYATLQTIAKDRQIRIVSDSAHAFGALYRGKAIPHWTDISVYSFHATKNLTTGEGGAIVSRHSNWIERARRLARHGIDRDAYMRKQGQHWSYDVPELGLKGNLSDILASVGLGELTMFDRNQEKRRKIADRYRRNLAHLQDRIELPTESPHCRSAWHLYIIKLHTGCLRLGRDQFIKAMARRAVECGVHYIPIPDFSAFRGSRANFGKLPVMDDVAARVVTLPLYPSLSLSEVDLVCEAVESVIRRNIKRTR